jgi:hypothetical protein
MFAVRHLALLDRAPKVRARVLRVNASLAGAGGSAMFRPRARV